MRCTRHGTALVWLLEELGGILSRLCRQRLVVLQGQIPHGPERGDSDSDRRGLSLGVAELVLEEDEGLCDKLVGDLLQAHLVCRLGRLEMKPQGHVRGLGREGGDGAVDELEHLLGRHRGRRGPSALCSGHARVDEASEVQTPEHNGHHGPARAPRTALGEVRAGHVEHAAEEIRVLVLEVMHEARDEALLLFKVLLVLLLVIPHDLRGNAMHGVVRCARPVRSPALHQRRDEGEETVHVVALVDDGIVLDHVAHEICGHCLLHVAPQEGEE
mmetsp:Transcript_7925/g.21685  ORF Transcript_7925/g.21685 Transcript_7925/m.21685 type:complete len:272 (-) Transcript_7925:1377-2192(-)